MRTGRSGSWLLITYVVMTTSADSSPSSPPILNGGTLTVVEDRGGVSAIPYYLRLHLLPSAADSSPALPAPQVSHSTTGEAALLPVRSAHLTPGRVTAQVLRAPGLTPFFLIGDDPLSRAWIDSRRDMLERMGAVGFVVRVESESALTALRRSAPRLRLVPASADDLASRLGLSHYPALVTATGIEQ